MTSAPLVLGYNLADAAAGARAEGIVGNAAAIGEKEPQTATASSDVFFVCI